MVVFYHSMVKDPAIVALCYKSEEIISSPQLYLKKRLGESIAFRYFKFRNQESASSIIDATNLPYSITQLRYMYQENGYVRRPTTPEEWSEVSEMFRTTMLFNIDKINKENFEYFEKLFNRGM